MPAWIVGLLAKAGQFIIGILVDKIWGLVVKGIARWKKSREIAEKKAEYEALLKNPALTDEEKTKRREALEKYLNSIQR